MHPEILLFRGLIIAEVTLDLNPQVFGLNVFCQQKFLGWLILAVLTLEPLALVLGGYVDLEVAHGGVHCVALGAGILDPLVLGLDVLDQRALQGERLAALPAREGLLASVEPLVVLEDCCSVIPIPA